MPAFVGLSNVFPLEEYELLPPFSSLFLLFQENCSLGSLLPLSLQHNDKWSAFSIWCFWFGLNLQTSFFCNILDVAAVSVLVSRAELVGKTVWLWSDTRRWCSDTMLDCASAGDGGGQGERFSGRLHLSASKSFCLTTCHLPNSLHVQFQAEGWGFWMEWRVSGGSRQNLLWGNFCVRAGRDELRGGKIRSPVHFSVFL